MNGMGPHMKARSRTAGTRTHKPIQNMGPRRFQPRKCQPQPTYFPSAWILTVLLAPRSVSYCGLTECLPFFCCLTVLLTLLLQLEFASAFHRLCGKRVLFPQGFHCTGMPIKVSLAPEQLFLHVQQLRHVMQKHVPGSP